MGAGQPGTDGARIFASILTMSRLTLGPVGITPFH